MSKLPQKLPRLNFRHILTGFSENLEKIFYDDYFSISLPVVRVALVLHIMLYALFGVLDIWIVPLHKTAVWIIRYGIICPLYAIVLIFTFSALFKKYMQYILLVISFMSGLGIVVMIAISAESELGFKFYYAGLMLVLMWIYALVRLRFVYGTLASWLIVVSYEIVAVTINKMFNSPENITVFINNNFFFISANIIGMFASFTIEWYVRKNFLLRLEVEKSLNLNQKYMDNIKEGLLLVDEKYLILAQYSDYLTMMFEDSKLEGKSFIDLVFPDEKECAEERKVLERFLKFLFHNRSADIDMIMSLNPLLNKKILIRSNEFVTKEIIINADFIRIYDKDAVEYIMVIFQDITDVVNYEIRLEEQKSRYEQEVESISAILRTGPAIFSDFLEESRSMLNDIRSNIGNLADRRVLDKVFRAAHSLKGAAGNLELNRISSISHELENYLVQARDNPDTDPERLKQLIDEKMNILFREFQSFSGIIDKFKEFSTLNNQSRPTEWKGSVGSFLRTLSPMVEKMARDLGKEVKLEIDTKLENIPDFPVLKNSIIHLLRNAVDHGIEDQYERLTKHKGASGRILLRLSETDHSRVIEVEDDGRGIDFEGIYKKAIERNLIEKKEGGVPKSKLLQLIFSPAFSSKDTATEISGRGYGLDIVKDSIEGLQGKISVQTKKDKGTKFTLTIPLAGSNSER